MLYYLAQYLTPYFSAFNVFNYHTVRAGGAAATGFLFCLIVGPRIIAWLRRLKIGQHIKKDHVHDLHELHKGKAGTPTMGGLIIIVATLLSLALWSTWTNRLMLAAVAVLCLMGAVGFVDDYIKLRRKRNDGLSARAKLIGQLLTGTLLGLLVVYSPVTYGGAYVSDRELLSWPALGRALVDGSNSALSRFGERLPAELAERIRSGNLGNETRATVVTELNRILSDPSVYEASAWPEGSFNGEATALIAGSPLISRAQVRLNRLLLEAAAPDMIEQSPRKLHTKVAIPGVKDAFIQMGWLYVPFVILIIIGATNGVNLTDGLDGLAAGASVVSIFAFTGIAYVISRADWSDYLFVTHVPEASELTVVGGALLGTGLGFLWFNAHPAEVFMGDTGSLALGGVLGALAVLTKQELLLPIVGGIFVLETLSVIIQVGSFKLRGKRVFRMAPLHHHFELLGWSETKVVIRFWILAMVFALMSLATLKLR